MAMNLRNIYDSRRIWKMVLLAVSLILVAIFIYFSNSLVKDLAKQERERMEIWADAPRELTTSTETDVDFLFRIIQGNRNIPVLLVDDKNNIIEQRNFKLSSRISKVYFHGCTTRLSSFPSRASRCAKRSFWRCSARLRPRAAAGVGRCSARSASTAPRARAA